MEINEIISDFSLKKEIIESILTNECISSFEDQFNYLNTKKKDLSIAEQCWMLIARFVFSGSAKRYNKSIIAGALDINPIKFVDGISNQIQMGLIDSDSFSALQNILVQRIEKLENNGKFLDMFLSKTGWTTHNLEEFKAAILNHTTYTTDPEIFHWLSFYSESAEWESDSTDTDIDYDENEEINDLAHSQYIHMHFKDQYNLLKQEIKMGTDALAFANHYNEYAASYKYQQTISVILQNFWLYCLVYDEHWQKNLFDDYLLNNLFEGIGQKTAFIRYVKSLDGECLKYCKHFYAMLQKHCQQENLPLPINLSSIISTDDLTEIDDEIEKEHRCDVVAEYACRFHYIEETQRYIFSKILKGEYFADNIKIPFKNGVTSKTNKHLEEGGARVAYLLIQYIQNPLSVKDVTLWNNGPYFKSIAEHLGFEFKKLRDCGYKLKKTGWEDIINRLIVCEKALNNGKSELENIIK